MNNINFHRININSFNKNSIPSKIIRNDKKDFEEIFDSIREKGNAVTFSKHAKKRMESRRIVLNENDIEKIDNAIGKAEKKGIKELLILMENKAFIANTKNKTIITTALQEQLKENLFTNIDGAVII